MQRTPPKTPTNSILNKEQPDIALKLTASSSPNKADKNITVRSKRQRLNDSGDKGAHTCSCEDLKTELLGILNTWKIEQEQTLSSWKADQDALLAVLVKDVTDLKKHLAVIKRTTLELDSGLTSVNKDCEELMEKVKNLEKGNSKKDECITHLENQIHDLNLQSRSASIELRNVPQHENEKSTDLVNIVAKVGKAVDLNIHESNLRDIYRLPGKQGSTPRSIVAEFTSVSKKIDFLTHVRRYNKERPVTDKLNTQTIGITGDKKPIYAAEHLTPTIRKLFYESRQLAREHKLSCYSLNGKIFMKKNPVDKPIQILSERCLSALISKI